MGPWPTKREESGHRAQGGGRTDRFTNASCISIETQEDDETAILLGDAMERRDFLWPGHYVSFRHEAHGDWPHCQLNYLL